MATSGNFDWTLSRDGIIKAALQKLGVIQSGDGNDPTATQITDAATALNLMVKSWQNKGVFLWTVEWVTKTFSASDEVTGTDSSVYTCIRSHTSAASNKPVTGANWSTVWRLRGSTGGVWTTATSYSSVGDFAVEGDTIGIEQAFIRSNNYSDTPLEIVRREKFHEITDKANTGEPSVLFFDNRLTPQIFLWPIPNDTTDVLHVLRVRMLENFDAAANNADFPVRWLRALIYGLAADLADDYKRPIDEFDRLFAKAEKLFEEAKGADKTISDSDFISPAYST